MADIKRYVFSQDVPEKEAILGAFKLCGDLLKGAKEPSEVVIFIPQIGSLGDNLQEVLGEDLSKRLLKDKCIATKDGKIRLETHRTFQSWKGPGNIIIGIYVTEEMLDQIDTVRNASAIIIVPWHIDDLRVWIKTWCPELIGGVHEQSGELKRDARIEQALNGIVIHPPTGLLHDLDRKRAIEKFRELKKNGISFEPGDIKAWALQNKWGPTGANELSKIAADILEGKRIR